jgi:dTDP-4-dehydrorhamnose reductase
VAPAEGAWGVGPPRDGGDVKVLITGAGGQLGQDLVREFADHDLVALPRADLDISDEAAVAAAVAGIRPRLVVDAAAWTDVDGCESDPVRAHRVNALGPWWLARACERQGATLVSVSTDYVFGAAVPTGPDGQPRGFTEFDPVAPLGAYGRSKAAGEQLVRDTLREHHIVRTAWLCGSDSFVTRIVAAARRHGRLRVIDDRIGSPTMTADLARAIRELAVSGRYGTWHRTNAGTASWYDLAVASLELAGVDVPVEPCSWRDWDEAAPRPAWSVLDNLHATTAGLTPLPDWRDGLARLVHHRDVPGSTP